MKTIRKLLLLGQGSQAGLVSASSSCLGKDEDADDNRGTGLIYRGAVITPRPTNENDLAMAAVRAASRLTSSWSCTPFFVFLYPSPRCAGPWLPEVRTLRKIARGRNNWAAHFAVFVKIKFGEPLDRYDYFHTCTPLFLEFLFAACFRWYDQGDYCCFPTTLFFTFSLCFCLFVWP